MSKTNMAQSVHQRLLNVRGETGEQFDHLLMRFGLERLLYRLIASGHSKDFVLKGAMLFALWHSVPGRPTRDLDLLGLGEMNHERVSDILAEVCTAAVIDDGLRFDADSIVTDDIRDDQEYRGIRVRLVAYLDRARLAIQVDIGFGDALEPEPIMIDYPTILDFPAPHLRAYQPAAVIAEKLNAMVVLGMLNSRVKDFYDIHIILRHMKVEDKDLRVAIQSTFEHRNVELPHVIPIAFTPEFLEDGIKETQWQAFLQRGHLDGYDFTLEQVATDLRKRLWPILRELSS